MNTRSHHPSFFTLSIILVLLLASCAESTYPGSSGTVHARIETSLPMFSFEGSARIYLSRFTQWETESGGIEISQPEFKITDHYTNDLFQYSSIEASIPYYVPPGTPAGTYDIKVTMYDAFQFESLVLTASLNVAESK